jgi:uncharacterized protein (DUF1499 family)
MDTGFKYSLTKNQRWSLCVIWALGMVLINVVASRAGSEDHLPPCPSTPNCISSQAADKHFVEPFSLTGDAKAEFDGLRGILEQRHDTTIVFADEKTLRVEFRTTLGFVDDGLFVLDPENRVIQVRSASRLGYWDFGKNRRRIEEIRRQFQNCMRAQ